MFDIGFQELVIIFIVALLVFGPKRLPEVGRTMGKWIGELRKGIYDAKMQMESEFEEIHKGAGVEPGKKVEGEPEKKVVEGEAPEQNPDALDGQGGEQKEGTGNT